MPLYGYNTYFNGSESSGASSDVVNAAHPAGVRPNGWIITSELWEAVGRKIILPINPEKLSIGLPIRGHQYEAAFGRAVAYSMNRRRMTHFDPFPLQITFNTGYVLPRWTSGAAYRYGTQPGEDTNTNLFPSVDRAQQSHPAPFTNAAKDNSKLDRFTQSNPESANDRTKGTRTVSAQILDLNQELYTDYVPIGVQNLYALTALLDGPKTWRPNLDYRDTFGKTYPNRIKIYANSLLFPNITLYGVAIDQGISWAESADSPTSFDVSFSMLVTATSPSLGYSQLNSLVSKYKQDFSKYTTDIFEARSGVQV